MLKGAQKRMIVIRTRNSPLFEEAYFVMRRDLPDAADGGTDMLQEANRIIEHSLGASSALLSEQPPRGDRRRWHWLWSVLFAAVGFLTGSLACALVFLCL